MLIIRSAQLQALAQQAREQFIKDMLGHVYRYFPTPAWLLTPDELRSRVSEAIDRAAGHQLTSRQQVCRFINLAATYGWAFDSDPELTWMRDILTDTGLLNPGERLDRLVNSCLHRQRIEARNLAQRRALGLLADDSPPALEPQLAADFSGLDSYRTTPPGGLEGDERFKANPSSHRSSLALRSDEAFFP